MKNSSAENDGCDWYTSEGEVCEVFLFYGPDNAITRRLHDELFGQVLRRLITLRYVYVQVYRIVGLGTSILYR